MTATGFTTTRIVTDGDERTLTYEEIVRAALALGHALKSGTKRGEVVGVLLPTGIGSVIAVLALTLLRLIPVALAMIGTGFTWRTVAFLGWFGPRGLATIVFGLLALEELGPNSPFIDDVGGVMAVTVILSVFAHGLSSGPLSKAYGEWVNRTDAPIGVEPSSAEPMSSRGRTGR
jgi:NhaP-type Na+/H+ or K+/H+ antiporter